MEHAEGLVQESEHVVVGVEGDAQGSLLAEQLAEPPGRAGVDDLAKQLGSQSCRPIERRERSHRERTVAGDSLVPSGRRASAGRDQVEQCGAVAWQPGRVQLLLQGVARLSIAQTREVRPVSLADRVCRVRLRVLTDCLEQPEPSFVVGEEPLTNQVVEHLVGVCIDREHVASVLASERRNEDRRLGDCRLRGRAEMFPRGVQRGPKRLARSSAEQTEAIVESSEDRSRRQQAGSGGCELDCDGQMVQRLHQLGDSVRVRGMVGSLGEELASGCGTERAERVQRVSAVHLATRQEEHDVRRSRRPLGQRRREAADRSGQLVDDDEGATLAVQHGADALYGVGAHRLVQDATEGSTERLDFLDARRVDEPGCFEPGAQHARGEAQREARLAHPADAGERQPPRACVDGGLEPPELRGTADEATGMCREVGTPRR